MLFSPRQCCRQGDQAEQPHAGARCDLECPDRDGHRCGRTRSCKLLIELSPRQVQSQPQARVYVLVRVLPMLAVHTLLSCELGRKHQQLLRVGSGGVFGVQAWQTRGVNYEPQALPRASRSGSLQILVSVKEGREIWRTFFRQSVM